MAFRRSSRPNEIAAADYIALASLRDSANLLPYRARFTDGDAEGSTSPSEIIAWMRDAGFQNVENHTHLSWRVAGMLPKAQRQTFGQQTVRQHVQMMQNRLTAGSTVIMCAAGSLAHMALGEAERDSKFMRVFGAHVTLVKAVVVGANGVDFTLVSWGKEVQNAVTIPWSKLGSWYQGFVCGEP